MKTGVCVFGVWWYHPCLHIYIYIFLFNIIFEKSQPPGVPQRGALSIHENYIYILHRKSMPQMSCFTLECRPRARCIHDASAEGTEDCQGKWQCGETWSTCQIFQRSQWLAYLDIITWDSCIGSGTHAKHWSNLRSGFMGSCAVMLCMHICHCMILKKNPA